MSSKGLEPSKMVFGILVLAALTAVTIYVPDARIVVGILVLFGFFDFLKWLEN